MENNTQIPFDFTLNVPIEWDDDIPRTKLTIRRRLKAKDFKGISATDMKFDSMLIFISKITGEPLALVEELDADDMIRLTEIVNSFLPRGLKTGENQ